MPRPFQGVHFRLAGVGRRHRREFRRVVERRAVVEDDPGERMRKLVDPPDGHTGHLHDAAQRVALAAALDAEQADRMGLVQVERDPAAGSVAEQAVLRRCSRCAKNRVVFRSVAGLFPPKLFRPRLFRPGSRPGSFRLPSGRSVFDRGPGWRSHRRPGRIGTALLVDSTGHGALGLRQPSRGSAFHPAGSGCDCLHSIGCGRDARAPRDPTSQNQSPDKSSSFCRRFHGQGTTYDAGLGSPGRQDPAKGRRWGQAPAHGTRAASRHGRTPDFGRLTMCGRRRITVRQASHRNRRIRTAPYRDRPTSRLTSARCRRASASGRCRRSRTAAERASLGVRRGGFSGQERVSCSARRRGHGPRVAMAFFLTGARLDASALDASALL